MKYGVRKPSLKKSISARAKGKYTRSMKRAVNPLYGKKGMGWANDPSKAAYNKIYNKTTISAKQLVNGTKIYTDGNKVYNEKEYKEIQQHQKAVNTLNGCAGCLGCLVALPYIIMLLIVVCVIFIVIASIFTT